MLRYFSLRLLRAFITIGLVVTFAFVVLRLSGDPALIILGPESAPEAIAALRKANPEASEQRMREHLRHVRDGVMKNIKFFLGKGGTNPAKIRRRKNG